MTDMSEPTVLYAECDGVATVTLNRPQALNSFTRQMHRELWVALDRAEANPVIRALVITGAGRGFCAGADLAEFDFEPGPDLVKRADPGPVIDQAFNEYLQQGLGAFRKHAFILTGNDADLIISRRDRLSLAQILAGRAVGGCRCVLITKNDSHF